MLSHWGLARFLNKQVRDLGVVVYFVKGYWLLFWDSFAAYHVTAAAWFEAKPSYEALVWGKVGSWPIYVYNLIFITQIKLVFIH